MKRLVSLVAVLLLLPSLLLAQSAVLGPAANPHVQGSYNYKNSIFLQDDFFVGSTTSGTVGILGWNVGGTISAGTGSFANNVGTVIVDTGASSGTYGRLNCLGASHISMGHSPDYTWVVKPAQIDANTTIHIGMGQNWAANPPGNAGVYFERLDADTNWFAVTRASSTETRTDTGVAASTNWGTFRIEGNASAARFYINGALVASNSTNVPNGSTYGCFGVHVLNSAAASKKIEVDYFEAWLRSISR